ncbi:MAG: tyrosine--tRNA ligase [Bacilli bacterium]|nr:tyrosine--tRNA ligase [Bacilli bacterium]
MENIIDELNWRGLIKDYSNEEEIKKLLSTPQTIYCGFDPSAKSMHMGNFVMISILMRLQRAGHKVIAVVGGATGMIGDPSGKSKERNLQGKEQLEENTRCIKEQLEKFIDLSDASKGIIVNNYDWLGNISFLDYLRDYGKYFPINYMLSKDIVASRLEAGISFTEFSYMTLQSVDFLTLHRDYGCNIQIGGADQWGNLTAGLELIRKLEGADANVGVLTAKLLTRADGKKFGKSEDGALFLNAELTSPYKLYQYFFNCSDEDAIRYLKVFSFKSKEEINSIEKEHLANPGARIGQKALAADIVETIHGKAGLDEALKVTEAFFSGDVSSLTKSQLENVLGGSGVVEVDSDLPLEDLLITCKAASSKREAREFIKGNSVLVNSKKVTDSLEVISKTNALFNEYTVIRRGKKNYYLVKHL